MIALRAALVAAALIGSVVLANVVTSRFGLIPAGFGLMVPAGTYAAGLALGLRDALHQLGGVRWVLGAIAAGVGVSALVGDGRIALASAVAFGLAELVDLLVYLPLRRRGWRRAVVASNVVGALVDSALFLVVAGFPLTWEAVAGQVLVKAVWLTLLGLAVGEVVTRVRREPHVRSPLADNLQTVPAAVSVRVTAAGYLEHECPHVVETDNGTAAISWTTSGATVELHSLARYLDAYEGVPISHESLTHLIAADLAGLAGIADVAVVTKWETSGLEVRVESGAR